MLRRKNAPLTPRERDEIVERAGPGWSWIAPPPEPPLVKGVSPGTLGTLGYVVATAVVAGVVVALAWWLGGAP